ncbi:MAG: hypothetical protein R3E98_03020 [Gemmatimonadota bacterium]|nr:hypothetical protein [Gemmatimonadota bacterium]
MGKLFLFALIAFCGALWYPGTRPRVVEAIEPALNPIHAYSTENEMERIAIELLGYDRTYYRLPTDSRGFGEWLDGRFTEESGLDSWGTPYALRVWDDSFAILSGGADREMGTPDDLRWLQDRRR